MPTGTTDFRNRLAVEDVVVRMFVSTDERDWATLQDCFSSPFTLDMTSMVISHLVFKLKFIDGNLKLEESD
jgi:hypothetical protein